MQKKTNRGTAAKAMKNVKAKDAKTAKALLAKQRANAKAKKSGMAIMTAPKSTSAEDKKFRKLRSNAHITNLRKSIKAHDKHAAAKKVSDSTRKKK
jgi:hypothetical protein